MDQATDIASLVRQLEAFHASSGSLSAAGEIESAIRRLFTDEDEIMELADDLAQYRPNGGDYLYSHEDMKPKVAYFLGQLRQRGQT